MEKKNYIASLFEEIRLEDVLNSPSDEDNWENTQGGEQRGDKWGRGDEETPGFGPGN